MVSVTDLPSSVVRAFEDLDARVRGIVGESQKVTGGNRTAKLTVLQPSARQLAREVVATLEFRNLALALLDFLARGEIDEEERQELKEQATDTLAELFRRSGYFHAVLSDESSEPYWERIAARAQGSDDYERLLVLGRVFFPRASFEICKWPVQRLSEVEVDLLILE